MVFEKLKVGVVYPTINGQQPYLTKDIGHVVGIDGIGADDFVEFAKHARKSSIKNLGELMFTDAGKSKNLSYLMPHEQLRFSTRLEDEIVRAGGVNMKSAPLWAPSGKCSTTPVEYVELAKFGNCSVTELMSDYDFDFRDTLSKKRWEKSQMRTETWLKVQLPLMANEKITIPVIYLPDDKQYERHVTVLKELLKNFEGVICGYSIRGLNINEDVDYEKLKKRLNLLPDGVKICLDLTTPREIFLGKKAGINLFGGHYASLQASNYKAVILPSLETKRTCDTIDLTDSKHAGNKDKLSPESSVDLSRAYVHHLTNVKEILAHILLMKHNLDQVNRFVELIRSDDNSSIQL